ncbi:MAG: NADH-quinone oxidoreductase subunit I [Deltaproteobacteria bacterium]|nr:NADH-quinone oxidoreductase subunit I [Deltaproteobacteria bacterium]
MFRQTVKTLRTSLTGMRITARYFKPGTEVTREYPEVPPLSFERTRGRMDVAMDRCTACTLCAKACPVECITIETEKKREGKGRRAARFVIDFSRCMFCGLCVEACPTKAIRHTGKCDFSSYLREDLVEDFGMGFYTEEEKTIKTKALRIKGTEGQS